MTDTQQEMSDDEALSYAGLAVADEAHYARKEARIADARTWDAVARAINALAARLAASSPIPTTPATDGPANNPNQEPM